MSEWRESGGVLVVCQNQAQLSFPFFMEMMMQQSPAPAPAPRMIAADRAQDDGSTAPPTVFERCAESELTSYEEDERRHSTASASVSAAAAAAAAPPPARVLLQMVEDHPMMGSGSVSIDDPDVRIAAQALGDLRAGIPPLTPFPYVLT